MSAVMAGFVMGIGGTVAMDIWAAALFRMTGQPMPNWGNVGRWVAHVGRGTVFHDDIGKATPVANEAAIGWVFHYAVGIIYGLFFAVIAGPEWLAAPSFVPVWIFALLTISAGWFLLHPGLGLGFALSKTARPRKGRALGLVAHTWFGLGMWLGALVA